VELVPGSDSLRTMNEQCPPDTEQITDSDWEQTPALVKQLVMDMAQRLARSRVTTGGTASRKPTAERANQSHIKQLIPGSLIRCTQSSQAKAERKKPKKAWWTTGA